ncbi:hypothetical protein ACIPRL_35315 [Streptomyces sp. NPDC090085]|uniref:hypothetical protein n=1 Tax=Streptomyces sp. NPDC090085 TaxID=3365943 RepID=UPI0037F9DC16
MTFIEPGLYVRDGFAEGPLADAALSRAVRGASRRPRHHASCHTPTRCSLPRRPSLRGRHTGP